MLELFTKVTEKHFQVKNLYRRGKLSRWIVQEVTRKGLDDTV